MNDEIAVNIRNLIVRNDKSRPDPFAATEQDAFREFALYQIDITLKFREKTLLLAPLRAGKSILLEVIRNTLTRILHPKIF